MSPESGMGTGSMDLWEVEVPVVDVQAPSVHSLQVSIYYTVYTYL